MLFFYLTSDQVSLLYSVFLYVRFFLVWIMVLTADFLLEFRFEYLWPFWLLLRSAYDSFKYQGLVSELHGSFATKLSRVQRGVLTCFVL